MAGEPVTLRLVLRPGRPDHDRILAWYESLDEYRDGRKKYAYHLLSALLRYLDEIEGEDGAGSGQRMKARLRKRASRDQVGGSGRGSSASVVNDGPAPEESRDGSSGDEREEGIEPADPDEFRRLVAGLSMD